MKDLTNAIIRLYLERGDLAGALRAASELENRVFSDDEWSNTHKKIPLEKIRQDLVKSADKKAQAGFIRWLEGGHDAISLIAFNEAFESQVNTKVLAEMMSYHTEEGDEDSEKQLCAGIPYLKRELPELTLKWALRAKEIAINKGNIDIALKAAEFSNDLKEEEIKDLLTTHIEALIAASEAEKENFGKSKEVLTEYKRILELFNAIPLEKQAIYSKVREFIF